MASSAYDFVRIFHPVGQGAFYSETHTPKGSNANSITVVYDCGTLTKDAEISKVVMKSEIAPDILFLSHLHKDHYNGIKYFDKEKLRLIVLPHVDDNLLRIEQVLGLNDFGANYMQWLHQQFPKAKIIRVTPENTDNGSYRDNSNNSDRPPLEDLTQFLTTGSESVRLSDTVESGHIFTIGGPNDSQWIYIPFNPRQDWTSIAGLRNALRAKGLEIARIAEPEYFDSHLKDIATAYGELKSVNEYSMVLYSGPAGATAKKYPEITHLSGLYQYVCDWPWRHRKVGFGLGCLYLGDINLNLKASMSSDTVLEYILSRLPNGLHENISTIQVPHHGSRHNFSMELLEPMVSESSHTATTSPLKERPLIFAISVGENNNFGHPAWQVLAKLMSGRNIVKIVTESPVSQFIEIGKY